MRYDVLRQGEVTVLAVAGRLDSGQSSRLALEWARLPEGGQVKIVLDLSGMEWVDSSGVGALVSLAKQARARGGAVKAAGLQRQPMEVFRLLRLQLVFELCDSVEEAVAHFAAS